MTTTSPQLLAQAWAQSREARRHLVLRGMVEAWVDGELPPHRAVQVAAHLERCFTCGENVEILQLIKTSLSREPMRAPALLAAARLRRLASQLADGGTGASPGRP